MFVVDASFNTLAPHFCQHNLAHEAALQYFSVSEHAMAQ